MSVDILHVANSFTTPRKCSICGASGILRRGWCKMHYARWYRTGDPNKVRKRAVSVDGKKPFSIALWQQWLFELNAAPNVMAVKNVEAVRNSIDKVESSTWNKHHGVPRR